MLYDMFFYFLIDWWIEVLYFIIRLISFSSFKSILFWYIKLVQMISRAIDINSKFR
jgi:hypothetical protein